jgi:hypothetical protein
VRTAGLRLSGQREEHQAALEELGKANPNDAFIQCMIGRTREMPGHKDKAMEFYRKASTASSHNPHAAYAVPFARKRLFNRLQLPVRQKRFRQVSNGRQQLHRRVASLNHLQRVLIVEGFFTKKDLILGFPRDQVESNPAYFTWS